MEERNVTLLILSFLGGLLTILSPCILPVLPFVFSRADQPFARAGLPMLLGMAITFTGVATLAAVGGGWAVEANQYGRIAALTLLALFAATLLSRALAERLARPLVAFGGRLSLSVLQTGGGTRPLSSFLLGVATGLLWAPCAGPILGLVLTGAALKGASVETSLLLFAYAAGAATALAASLLAGRRLLAILKRFVGPGEWLRRGLGTAVLAAVIAIALGWDTGLLSQVSFASTASIEQTLIDRTGIRPRPASRMGIAGGVTVEPKTSITPGPQDAKSLLTNISYDVPSPARRSAEPALSLVATGTGLPIEGSLPGFSGAVEWLNSPPLTPQALRGKVVLVNFWTFGCINCLHVLPYVRAWAEKYKDHGLVVVGVHTPELAFERDIGNVRAAVARLKISYPVAIDNSYAIWKAFNNEYWPAAYFVDAEGHIRHHHFGEHDHENSERVIQRLLEEAGNSNVPGGFVTATSSSP
jgi:cytochrome c biogenesis protein CcdA/thiol-disulfide isomerase/thioredoxin